MTPKGWRTTTLGEATEIIMGTSPPSSAYNAEQVGMPLLNGPAEFGPRYPTPVQWTTAITRTCEVGDVLLCVRGSTTGRQNIADQPYCIGRGLAAIRGTDVASESFLQVSLEQLGEAVLRRARGAGSTFPNINAKELQTWPLLLPPLPEQKKIAAILGSVDEAIAATQAVIDQTRKVKHGLLQQLLTRGIGHTRFKKTEIGEIPAEWDVCLLGQIFSERKEAGRPGLPVMSVTIGSGLVERMSLDRRVESELTPEKHLLVRKGDLTYNTMRMWQGVSGVASCDCVVSPAYVVCSPSKRMLPAFASHFFKAPTTIQKLHSFSQGLTNDRLRLYFHNFTAIPIALPPIDEQRHIAAVLDNEEAALSRMKNTLDKAIHLKQGLMQDLLTGRVRVKGAA